MSQKGTVNQLKHQIASEFHMKPYSFRLYTQSKELTSDDDENIFNSKDH